MPSMMVRYAGSKVFVALQATEFGQEGIDEGAEVCFGQGGGEPSNVHNNHWLIAIRIL